ncbi:MAG: signal recognition particle protein, partial [Campylobacterales bacterium]|nr:signal recognition particle protein [Campylobacterales bacterium]
SKAMKDFDFDNSSELKNIRSMVNSMTKKEREDPDLLNNSRKQRIATGCGLSVVEVNRMIKQFKNAGKMAKKFSGKSGMKNLQSLMRQMGGPGGLGGIPR